MPIATWVGPDIIQMIMDVGKFVERNTGDRMIIVARDKSKEKPDK